MQCLVINFGGAGDRRALFASAVVGGSGRPAAGSPASRGAPYLLIAATDVTRGAHLAFLAPDIVQSVLRGEDPPSLNAEQLIHLVPLPMDWTGQRAAQIQSLGHNASSRGGAHRAPSRSVGQETKTGNPGDRECGASWVRAADRSSH